MDTGSSRDEAFQRPWLNYIIHELLADWSYLLWQGSTEHHHLLLMGGHFEHFLNISTHVYKKRKEDDINYKIKPQELMAIVSSKKKFSRLIPSPHRAAPAFCRTRPG